jgi:hypothetical protein
MNWTFPSTTAFIREDAIHIDDLEISFQRTLRVPDNFDVSNLPSSIGQFPLEMVRKYVKTLPQEIINKGGLFFPMHRKQPFQSLDLQRNTNSRERMKQCGSTFAVSIRMLSKSMLAVRLVH